MFELFCFILLFYKLYYNNIIIYILQISFHDKLISKHNMLMNEEQPEQ